MPIPTFQHHETALDFPPPTLKLVNLVPKLYFSAENLADMRVMYSFARAISAHINPFAILLHFICTGTKSPRTQNHNPGS